MPQDPYAAIAQPSAPPADPYAAIAEAPPAESVDPGTLSKVWDWANKGLISGKTLLNVVGDIMPRSPDMKPGETATEFLDRVQNHIDPEHPYLNALKVGLAGVDKDVAKTISSFSSPLSIALMGTGAATKIPGAVGTVAKAVTGLTGAGIATKGVSDIAEPTGNSPEAWQQRLQGGAEVAGGGAMAEPALSAASDAAPGAIRAAARGANKVLAKAPGTVGATIGGSVGAAIGHATGIPGAAVVGGGILGDVGAHIGKEVLPQVRIPGEGFGLPNRVEGGPATAPQYDPSIYPGAPLPEHPRVFPGANLPEHPGEFPGAPLPEHPGTFPGASLPETPAPELLQAQPLAQGGAAPSPEPAAVLGSLPVRAVHQAIQELGPQAPLADLTTRAVHIAKLEELLGQGLGAKQLQPNVPLKEQGGVVTPKSEPASGIPEGHTPVESSALKSYKYDPSAHEFESVTTSGAHYIHGDVSPEQASAFEAAPSKGKAWNELRKNSTLVAKVVNGKRVPVRPVLSEEDAIPEDEWQAGHELSTEVEGSAKQ